MRACLEARLLISRRPIKSPLLKLPFPCLNSHKVESGDPVWKTSLTNVRLAPRNVTSPPYDKLRTFVESIHIQLSDEGRDVGMLEVLSANA